MPARKKPETEPVAEMPSVTPQTYGYAKDAELFAYTPTGYETIWLPMKFDSPDAVWLWELYSKPFHVQTWEWMNLAGVPRRMQRKAVELLRDNEKEYVEMFNSWFKAMGGGSAGES